MNNLDIHIVGLGNLGSSLLKGLKSLDNNLTFHLYEKEPKIISKSSSESRLPNTGVPIKNLFAL